MSVVHVGHPPREWDCSETHFVHFHNFASLPSEKYECVTSPWFTSFGSQWIVRICPGGESEAKAGNVSLFLENWNSRKSTYRLSVMYSMLIAVLKSCAKGSILASLCDDCDGITPVPMTDVAPEIFHLMLHHLHGGEISLVEWMGYRKDLIEAADKYGSTNLKIESEVRYVKLVRFSPGDVVEAVAYAEKMNCFLVKEVAIDFIVANPNDVLLSDTLKNIPESNEDIIRSVAMMKQGHTQSMLLGLDLN